MMKILILTILCLLPSVTWADGVTFTNATTTFTVPVGFTQSSDAPNPAWKYFTNPDGAGLRVMGAMGNLVEDQSGNVGVFWAALTNSTPFTGNITFNTTVDVCYNGACKPASFSGALGYGANGLIWTLPIPATTLSVGGSLIQLFDASNGPRGVVQTVDGAVSYRVVSTILPTAVPEPMTLTLLGLGLAGMAGVVRRKKKIL